MTFSVRFIRAFANWLIVLSIALSIAIPTWWWMNQPQFQLKHIYVESLTKESLEYISAEDIAHRVNDQEWGNFFTVDLDQLQQQISELPWVKTVQIRRLWPDSLALFIEEHKPFAYWNKDQVMDDWGDVFTPVQVPIKNDENMLYFSGPEASEKLVARRYNEVSNLLAPIQLSIEAMSLDERYAWSIKLSNGMTILLGRDPEAESLTVNKDKDVFSRPILRFVKSWSELQSKIGDKHIDRVDLRYNNGFAIRFADQSSK